MHDKERTLAAIGDEAPLLADSRAAPPDRREISARWLSGTFLTGLTSSVLMGVALIAALDGREFLATPPEIVNLANLEQDAAAGEAVKAQRLIPSRTSNRARDRRRMDLATMTREGDREVVRSMPFMHVSMALAAGHTTTRDYPRFDPMKVFAEVDAPANPAPVTAVLYGAPVESEVSLKTVEFPFETATFDERSDLSADEVEQVVRNTGAILTDGDIQIAALHYVDPQRFGESFATQAFGTSYGARVTQENVSFAPRDMEAAAEYAEDIIPVMAERKITDIFKESGYETEDSEEMSTALASLIGTDALREGSVLRIGMETRGDTGRIMRASVYDGARHRATIAIDDKGSFVQGSAPEMNPAVQTAFEDQRPVVRARGDLPTVYDGVYRAAFAYGMTSSMTQQMIRLLASEVDYQARLKAEDQLDVFFSNPDEENRATEASELLFVKAHFGGNTRNFFRFRMEDGTIDYFDEDGRSARQFLLRNPLPNGRFRSGFGMRRHPILGYSRLHSGVDWSAPTGTPIIAAGNGVVEKAGWAGGYGRQIMIRHANGYVTSYNHQSRFADGIKEGARVRQGQVIGYVGSTGLSTGPHLHYELLVNGSKVDPMRVRLPTGRTLEGPELEAFKVERDRIVALLEEGDASPLRVASTN
jgi:murein DD-endopeptidase MepM/ murein hydrolase activator NlpD